MHNGRNGIPEKKAVSTENKFHTHHFGHAFNYTVLIFQVYIIVLISDRKYNQFRPVLDAYIDSAFSFAMAYK